MARKKKRVKPEAKAPPKAQAVPIPPQALQTARQMEGALQQYVMAVGDTLELPAGYRADLQRGIFIPPPPPPAEKAPDA